MNPKPMNPKPMNPKPMNPKPMNPKPMNPKPMNPKLMNPNLVNLWTSPWPHNLVDHFRRLKRVTAAKITFATAVDPPDTMPGTAPT